MFLFRIIILLITTISIIQPYTIPNNVQKLTQTSRRQILGSKERFHTADEHDLPSEHSRTFLLTMLPVDKGDHVFNGEGEQEWEIQKDTTIKFAIYGM